AEVKTLSVAAFLYWACVAFLYCKNQSHSVAWS
ncbi:MAG: hypothetical protein ACI8XW_003767, partial [Gammaproteobacteria bacterium]